MSKTFIEAENAASAKRIALNGETMGTRYSAIYYADADHEEQAVAAALLKAVTAVDAQMSTWKPESDLCRLNAAPLHEWITVPKGLMKVLAAGLAIEQRSSGSFDMNVGALVAASGFGAMAGQTSDAGSDAVSAGKALEIRENLNLVRKIAPVSLDLSGIAKGFGVDEMARCLEQFSIHNYLVGIDGEMRAKGRKPGNESWAVALERPVAGVRSVMGVVNLENMAIATSGDYRHFRDVDGMRISHTMDPSAQAPLANSIASVTVLAETCMEADALATVLMVKGESEGPAFAAAQRIHALFLVRDHDQIREIPVGPYFADGSL